MRDRQWGRRRRTPSQAAGSRVGATALGALATVLCAVASPPAALAQTETPRFGSITVSPPAQGSVTGVGIDCPGECYEELEWLEFCELRPRVCTPPPKTDLTANRAGDWAAVWSGCTPRPLAPRVCTVTLDGHNFVSVAWEDTIKPTVTLVAPAGKVGPVTTFAADAQDGASGVQKVDFHVDGTLAATDAEAPYEFRPDLTDYADGSAHTLTAIATDHAGLASPTTAIHAFTVDRSTRAIGVSTPPRRVRSAPTFSFSIPADVSAGDVTCRTKRGTVVIAAQAPCSSPYTAQVGTDGEHAVDVTVKDDVGNVDTVTPRFILDTDAPDLTLTAPAAGAFLRAPFTPRWTVSDGPTPADPLSITCRIDNRAFGPCNRLSAPDGVHSLTVRAVDLAQNETRRTVRLTYDTKRPVLAITGGPADESVLYASATAFDFKATDASPITQACSVDGGPFAPCTAAGRHELTGLSLGIHAIMVRVVDAAGNATEAQRRFVVATREETGGGETTVSEGEAPPVAPFKPTIRSRFSARRAWTTFSVLQLRDLPSDARVVFACKGGGCPVKRRTLSHDGGTLDVRKLVGRRLRLRAGAVLELRITSAQGDVKVARWAMRRGKLPKDSYHCAAPGQRLGACS